MQQQQVTHYQAYKPRPFTKEERSKVTVLFGGLTWKHERLVQGVMHNLNYKAEPLPNVTRADLDAGKELIDVGACCPRSSPRAASSTSPRPRLAAEGKQEVLDKYVFMTAGACGPCRFGQYHESYSMALDGLGLRDFRMFLLAQNQLDQGAGTGGGSRDQHAALDGHRLGDPVRGRADRPRVHDPALRGQRGPDRPGLRESIEYLYDVFRDRPLARQEVGRLRLALLTDYFTELCARYARSGTPSRSTGSARSRRSRLPVSSGCRLTRVTATTTSSAGSSRRAPRSCRRRLPSGSTTCMHQPIFRFEERKRLDKHAPYKILMVKGIEHVFHGTYNRLRKALGELAERAAGPGRDAQPGLPFYNFKLRGGEGHMLVARPSMPTSTRRPTWCASCRPMPACRTRCRSDQWRTSSASTLTSSTPPSRSRATPRSTRSPGAR